VLGLASVEWSEDQIEQAIKRHPDAENGPFRAFRLLVPAIISPAWSTGSVYAHATLIRSTVMTQYVPVLCGRAAFLAMMLEFGHRQYSAS
jgi:hypothetical protein